MADIRVNYEEVMQVINEMKQESVEIAEQTRAMNEVIQIIEESCINDETGRLCSCIRHNQKKLRDLASSFEDITSILEWNVKKLRKTDQSVATRMRDLC